MTMSIQEIKKSLKPFTEKGIVRTSLNDYAIIGPPRNIADSLTPKSRRKIESKYHEILSNKKTHGSFYIHFELCTRKCSGCHYGSVVQGNIKKTVKAILDHIDLFPSHKYSLDKSDIRFGGGTPSLMNIKQIKTIYDKIVNKFNIKKLVETTFEIHPEAIRLQGNPESYIRQLRTLGITRVSLGMQECNNKILKKWQRGHTKHDALKIYELLKKYKFKTNIDLMWNLPNQTFKSLEKSLRTVFELNPETVCTYFYWLRPETKDYNLYKKDKLNLLNKPIEAKCLIKSLASEYGYKQKKPEWFHKEENSTRTFNPSKYSKNSPSLDEASFASISFGPSSYSYLFSGLKENYMLWSPVSKNIKDYSANNNYRKMIDSGYKPHDKILIFKKEETIRLHLMFKLRSGTLSENELSWFINKSRNKAIKNLVNGYIKCGLLTWNKNHQLILTDAGDMIPNHVIASFATDEWLFKMMKNRNEKEDRYFWFPGPKIVFTLKNMVRNST